MIHLYRFNLPFRQIFRSSGNGWQERTGVILRYQTDQGDLLCEASPLPGFSSETIDDVENWLTENKDNLEQVFSSIRSIDELDDFTDTLPYPSLQCMISAAGLQLIAGQEPDTLADPLNTIGTNKLHVNAVFGIESHGHRLRAIDRAYRAGYRSVKLKCGPDPAPFFELMERIVDRYPALYIRIDANRSWNRDQALRILNKCTRFPIEYCEEPCPVSTPEEAADLRKESPIPLALDESIQSVTHLQQLLDSNAADVVIIKPMLLGSLSRLSSTLSNRPDPETGVVITTTLESGIGRTALNQFAMQFGSADRAHGLDTGRLFNHDLITTPSRPVVEINSDSSWAPRYEQCNREHLTPIL